MIKKRLVLYFTAVLFTGNSAFAQDIKLADVTRTVSFLASDEMKGRKVYSPEIDKAADFIADEFKKAGLQPLTGNSFLQSFTMVTATQEKLTAKSGDTEIDPRHIIVLTSAPELSLSSAGMPVENIKAGENFFSKAIEYAGSGKSIL